MQAKSNESAPPLVMIILRSKIPFLFLTRFCSSGYQPLHQSAMNGRLEICRLLVEARADVQAKDNESAPPPLVMIIFTQQNSVSLFNSFLF